MALDWQEEMRRRPVTSQEIVRAQDAELARLRAEVGRLIAAWPTNDGRNEVIQLPDGRWWVIRGKGLHYPTREAAVRAAAGLDAGDGSTGPATHGEGETV